MSKAILLIMSLFFLAPVSSFGQKKSISDRSEFIGRVQVVRDEEADIEFENGKRVDGKRRLSSLKTYDIKGNQLVYAVYNDDGGILWKDTNIYDANGRLTEQRTEHSPFTYLPDRKVFVYDNNGNLIETVGYDLQNKLLGKYFYAYDAQHNLIEEETARPDDNKLYYGESLTKYKYDESGNRIEKSTYQRDGSGLKPYDFRLGYYKIIYLFDSSGRQIGTNYIGLDDKLYRTGLTNFDEKGNEIESAVYNADGTINSRTSYGYIFDEQGNWVNQITSEWVTEDGNSFFRPTDVVYRTITYFKSDPNAQTKSADRRSNLSKNNDQEDYAVYAAILNQYFDNEKLRLLVVKKFTSGYNTDTPDDRRYLSKQNMALKEVDQSTIDDFVEKNRNKHYQLLDELLKLKGKHVLITDARLNEIFARDCYKGWDVFYKKYPDSQGSTTLSRVGFNDSRTEALVYVGTQSQCLAGAGHLIMLGKQSGVWKVIRSSMLWIS